MKAMFLAAVLVAMASCNFAEAEQANDAGKGHVQSASATRVEVATLLPSDASITLALPGEVEGSRDAVLASSLGGQVERVYVDDGDAVRKGQRLVSVDAEIYAAQVAQGEAQLALAESTLRRTEQLGDLASEATLDKSRTDVEVARASLRMSRAQLDRAVIDAPFEGIIGQIDLEVGEYVGPGSPVVRVVDLDPVKITLSVPDRDVVALVEGMEVTVSANARSGLYSGTVTHIGPAADLRTRAFPVEVEVANPDRQLLPGMIVNVVAQRTLQDDALVIPQEWVVSTLTDQGVFLAAGGYAVWRPVALGQVVRDQVVVRSGLQAGDRIVITGHRDLAPGDELLISRTATCCSHGRAVFGDDATSDGVAE